MLNAYEQKVLILYLINAVEFMKKDPNNSFCLEKVTDLIKTVQNACKHKRIGFNLKENLNYNFVKQPKKLYSLVADDIIAQLKTQLNDLKDKKLSPREKTFKTLQKLFRLDEDEINVFKLYCRNELDNIICDILCLAQQSNGHCTVSSMCQHYLNIKKSQHILDKLVDIGLLYNRRGNRGFNYDLPNSIESIIEDNCSALNNVYNRLVGNILKANLKKNDFKHIKDEFDTLETILKNALEQKTKGVNILFYGEVGAGKTEMAKTIAKCLKTPLLKL